MADSWDFKPTFDNPTMTEWPAGTDMGPPPAAPAPPAAPPAAAAPADPLTQDPTYQAFRRALGLQRSNAQASYDQQYGDIESQRQPTLDWMGHQNDLANQNIAGSMEARGLHRSGETEQNLANQGAAYGRQTSQYTQGVTARENALRQALAQQQVGFGTGDAEQQAAAFQRIAQNQAEQQLASQQAAYQEALLAALRSGGSIPDPNINIAGL